MMLLDWLAAYKLAKRLNAYRPQTAKFKRTLAWLRQYSPSERSAIRKTLPYLIFVDEQSFVSNLCEENEKLLARLKAKGITPAQIIYASVHDAGSSSQVCLNLLRDHGRLARSGCHFVDSKDVKQISALTGKIGNGVIVYVDDFAGTGKQFSKAQQHLAEFVQGNFSHHVIFHTVCPEAYDKIEKTGVSICPFRLHRQEDRPLHPASDILLPAEKDLIRKTCRRMSGVYGLGFNEMATMVVFYRNSPNTIPMIFRGQIGQTPWFGVVPRFDDMPSRAW